MYLDSFLLACQKSCFMARFNIQLQHRLQILMDLWCSKQVKQDKSLEIFANGKFPANGCIGIGSHRKVQLPACLLQVAGVECWGNLPSDSLVVVRRGG